MNQDKKDNIPEHLQELIQNKPSSRLKLLAAWDGLSVETQIRIIYTLSGQLKYSLPNELKKKISSNNNDYVRYLIAEHSHFKTEEETELLLKLKQSENPLVKYAVSHYSLLDFSETPEKFFLMTADEQLSCIACCYCRCGEGMYFAKLLNYALDSTAADEKHLINLAEEYFGKLQSAYNYREQIKSHDFVLGEKEDFLNDFNSLISIANKFPNKKELTKRILWGLPFVEDVGGEDLELIAQKMPPDHLKYLFGRKDVRLRDLRKKIFFSNEFDEKVRIAAASNNIEITIGEFDAIIKNNDKSILQLLIKAAGGCGLIGLPPVFVCALEDINYNLKLVNSSDLYFRHISTYFNSFADKYDTSLDKKAAIEKKLREFGLYTLASEIAPWRNESREFILKKEDNALKEKIVKNDPWATYMAFRTVQLTESLERRILDKARRCLSPALKHLFPPNFADDLFGEEGREGDYFNDKLDFLHQEITGINQEILKFKNYITKEIPKLAAIVFVAMLGYHFIHWIISYFFNN